MLWGGGGVREYLLPITPGLRIAEIPRGAKGSNQTFPVSGQPLELLELPLLLTVLAIYRTEIGVNHFHFEEPVAIVCWDWQGRKACFSAFHADRLSICHSDSTQQGEPNKRLERYLEKNSICECQYAQWGWRGGHVPLHRILLCLFGSVFHTCTIQWRHRDNHQPELKCLGKMEWPIERNHGNGQFIKYLSTNPGL